MLLMMLFGVTRLQLRNVTPGGTIGLCLSDNSNTPFFDCDDCYTIQSCVRFMRNRESSRLLTSIVVEPICIKALPHRVLG